MTLAGGMPGPPGTTPPAPPRPPPWRPPRPPPEPPPEVLWPLAGPLIWAWINRCGSSLSASLSFQRPLKSTPAGGACSSPSLAHAERHITVTTTTSRMPQYELKLARTGIAGEESAGGAACSRGCPQILGSANPHAAFERLKAHAQRF